MEPLDVHILQPYIPAYRVPLFDNLSMHVTQAGGLFRVYAAQPTGEQAARNDGREPAYWRAARTRAITVRGKTLYYRGVDLSKTSNSRSVFVSELAAGNLDGWRLSGRKRGVVSVLWGHGKAYVHEESAVARKLELQLARRADAVMTYTATGARALIQEGVPASRVTAIGNATDTRTLRASLLAIEAPESLERQRALGLVSRLNALYIGGLDEQKRLPFLLDAAKHANKLDGNFRLIVVGSGQLEPLVRAAVTNGYAVWVPEARGRDLACLGHLAQCLWMPGRVGLVALDALALGLPILTTDFPYHGPEVDFCRGEELILLPDEPRAFAEASFRWIERAPATPRERPLRGDIPDIENVSRAFLEVLHRACANRGGGST